MLTTNKYYYVIAFPKIKYNFCSKMCMLLLKKCVLEPYRRTGEDPGTVEGGRWALSCLIRYNKVEENTTPPTKISMFELKGPTVTTSGTLCGLFSVLPGCNINSCLAALST